MAVEESKQAVPSDSTVERDEKPKAEKKGGNIGVNVKRYADLIGIVIVLTGVLWPMLMGDGSGGPPKLEVLELDQSFYKTVLYPDKPGWDKGGPNDANVSWAVFFHKPYCGACRRIRPIFHALARHTNSSEHLRFASVDCVKYRVFCKREKIDREPLIRLYQATAQGLSPSETPLTPPSQKKEQSSLSDSDSPRSPTKKKEKVQKIVRRGVADWKGMLVAYEVLNWFYRLQGPRGPLEGKPIAWPDDDTLASAMAHFKASTLHTGVKLEAAAASSNALAASTPTHDPTGYLVDAASALHLGLVDDVFGSHTAALEGQRLQTLMNWVETLAHVYPDKPQRAAFMRLRLALGKRDTWGEKAYAALLQEWGGVPMAVEPPPTGESVGGLPSVHYRWCRSNEAGVGGYPCGLWLLFHTMLANTEGHMAHLTLGVIHDWVESFYGCVECAVAFNTEWEDEAGADAKGHVQTHLWLWKVHNMVRARITQDDDTTMPKVQWPSPATCPHCISDIARARLGLPPLNETANNAAQAGSLPQQSTEVAVAAAQAGESLVAWRSEDWQQDYVFAYLQETFCAGSDTFVCAGFTDVA